jgi:hypothetical protein
MLQTASVDKMVELMKGIEPSWLGNSGIEVMGNYNMMDRLNNPSKIEADE